MRFYADLHVHSRFSRATSSDCDLFHLAYWARRKGITVVGTGDFTHPAWMQELKNQLVPAEPGLYRLRDDLDRAVDERLAAPCRGPTRFMLSVEISTIYKKGDRTRKIHHLIYAPDFEAADRLSRALGRVGNLLADGRPILGLDSRHLLEATLESSEGSYLVPAHIWTPWFSVLGSKAGFDAVDECYGDLARHVFALETGLSSDPAMNWRISQLDRYRLVSSSDAHSPAKLGREATAFDTPLDYFYIKRALETGEGFGGTVEFFPEEGKYHLDGHRSCKVVLEPSETRARKEICPACGRPVTVGVLHRVEALADRAEGFRPEGASDFKCMVPLPEILGELHGVGADSRAVRRSYDELLSRVGPELYLLEEAPMEEIERAGPPRLWEALSRMRAGQVIRKAGYDGEYGVIRLFQPEELRKGRSARLLFEERKVKETESVKANASGAVLAGLDADQRAAAEVTRGPLLILAGPGTGKTRTLTHRIAHLVRDEGAAPEACLTITFTRRAAEELRERLSALLGPDGARVPAMTFHALGLSILREHAGLAAALRGGETEAPISVAGDEERRAILAEAAGVAERRIPRMLQAISGWKRRSPRGPAALPEGGPEPSEEIARAWQAYEAAMAARGLLDLDDLVGLAAALVEAHPEVGEALRSRYRYVSIDEYQDIDAQQYRLARFLVGDAGDVCAIGDPDQAIYGFRGADVGFFFRFQQDFPAARVVRLRQSYRSSRAIVDAALSVIAPSPTLGAR
ncbi:MAG TPA: UvrD-helicase domain-containing protein, partial [Candidatus Nanopelagicales bacterium]|nr:UvrD-helicase domain-containing protein [Candidatus Nanopelagicales bacterium]